MKNGRKRVFLPIADLQSEIDHLRELHSRATDLIEDLPDEAREKEWCGHTMNRLYLHMIQAEHRLMASIQGDVKVEPVVEMEDLESFTAGQLADQKLSSPYLGLRFDTIGHVIRHLQWHWTYHAGQMGMVRKQLGYPYKWR